MATTDKSLLHVTDLAREMGLSRSRVYQLVAAGALPCCRVAGRIVVPRPAWESWIAGRTAEALAHLRNADGTSN